MAPETRAWPARSALLVLLALLAGWRDALPSPVTAAGLAALTLLAILARFVVERPRDARAALRTPLVAALGFTLLAAASAVAGAAGEGSPCWWLLFGVPSAIALAWPARGFLPQPRPLAVVALAAIALGVIAAEPFEEWSGRVLVAAIAVVILACTGGEIARGVVPHGLPRGDPRARRRAAGTALFFALLITALGAGVEFAVGRFPRDWGAPPPPEPREDHLADRLQMPPAASELLASAIALVRPIDPVERRAPPPVRLFLRERVLDAVDASDGLVYLAPRSGPARRLRDEDDGDADGRIAWPESGGRADRASGPTFQVTLLRPAPTALLLVSAPTWVEGAALEIAADGALERPTAPGRSFTYRVGGSPQLAAASEQATAVAALDPERTLLPELFDGRNALQAIVDDVATTAQDDLARVRAFESILRRTGRLDERAPFRRWSEFAGARAGSALHFAQALALLARLAKIPSRVVAGWSTRAWDAVDQSFAVRGGDAHWWTEVELEGRGWVGLDPTPERVVDAPPPPTVEAPSAVAEAANPQTLGATLTQQRPLVAALVLIALVIAFLLLPETRARVKQLFARRAPAGGGHVRRAWRYWQELIELCRRAGLVALPGATATEFAQIVSAEAPAEASRLALLLRVYHGCRFGDEPLAPADEGTVRALLSALPSLLAQRSSRRADAPDRSRR